MSEFTSYVIDYVRNGEALQTHFDEYGAMIGHAHNLTRDSSVSLVQGGGNHYRLGYLGLFYWEGGK
jgi:hypothetical protein